MSDNAFSLRVSAVTVMRFLSFIFVISLGICVKKVEMSSDTMKKITSGFLKVLDQCKRELNLTDQVLLDLYHFWKEDYELVHHETGCAIVCMSHKLDILDETGNLHHGNAQEFAKKHGAADETASKLVTIIHSCEKQQESQAEPCVRALEVAKCFRAGIHELNWAPKMDVIVTEVLTEI